MPMPLSGWAQASDATCVPWPSSSTVGGPAPRLSSKSAVATILLVSSGCAPSTPVSMIATRAPSPRAMSHAAGRFSRAAHHSVTVPFSPRSGVAKAGSLGT